MISNLDILGLFVIMLLLLQCFWICFFRKWVWIDKNVIIRLRKVDMIKDYYGIENQSNVYNFGLFCCMVIDDNRLECISCIEEYGYICEGQMQFLLGSFF